MAAWRHTLCLALVAATWPLALTAQAQPEEPDRAADLSESSDSILEAGDPDAKDPDVIDPGAGANSDAGSVTVNPSDSGHQPRWAVGVLPEKQERAQMLYREANELVAIASVTAAVAKYREALRYWDHPMIRYNLAVVLLERERPIEAYEHLVAALRYGPDPLGPANYKRATRDHRALQARLVSLAIRCSLPGVEISLDGRTVLSKPGQATQLAQPGQHELLVKSSAATVTATYPLWPDRHYDIAIDPSRAIKRRWQRWIPWAVTGAGVGLSLLGGAFHWRASDNFAAFDAIIREQCGDGCGPGGLPEDAVDLESRAMLQNRLAGGFLVVGTSVVLTGAILVFLNRSRRVDSDAFEVIEKPFAQTLRAPAAAERPSARTLPEAAAQTATTR